MGTKLEMVVKSVQGQPDESELRLLQQIEEAVHEVDRFFPYLEYGETLIKRGRLEEARDVLMLSAQIALSHNARLWLVLSHEQLGDLSAAEKNWFGALHHYRYALRTAALFAHPPLEKLHSKAESARLTLYSTPLLQDSTIRPLHQEYTSGNMAISFVHRDIFVKKYFAHCLQCGFCHDWCCSFGADIDLQNVDKIRQHREEILPFVRPPEGEWFDAESTYYEEYPGNQYTRINPQGARCVFISKDQRGCGLHRYALSRGVDYHEIKPLVCTLFPLSFGEGILSLAAELEDNSLVCSGAGYSAYRAMKAELEFYFGRALVEELDALEQNVLGGR